MPLVDRLLTIVITAVLTSAAWIVAGGSLIELADSEGQRDATRPAEAAPSPLPLMSPSSDAETTDEARPPAAPALDTDPVSAPEEGETGTLRIPVLNVRPSDLSDTFTDARGSGVRLHEALDIMAPEGTSVVAAAPGIVEKLHRSASGGNTIYLRSQDRMTIHFYAHLGEFAQGLREGQRVRRGQRLGTVGSTGNAAPEAPHLHFAILRTTADAEWWEPSNAINPYPLLSGKQR